jgi:hypothetical protein
MKVLLTFIGFHEPCALVPVGEEQQLEAILSPVGARSFSYEELVTEDNEMEID